MSNVNEKLELLAVALENDNHVPEAKKIRDSIEMAQRPEFQDVITTVMSEGGLTSEQDITLKLLSIIMG